MLFIFNVYLQPKIINPPPPPLIVIIYKSILPMLPPIIKIITSTSN